MKARSISTTKLPPSNVLDGGAVPEDKPKKPRVKRHQKDKLFQGQKFIIKPTPLQQKLLSSFMGATRWVWNTTLFQQNEAYNTNKTQLKASDVSKELTQLKKQDSHAWLNNMPATVINMSFQHLNTSWQAYFDGQSGKRADQPKQPKFKKKDKTSVSFQVDPRHKNPIDVVNNTINIVGLGPVKAHYTEDIHGELSYITISKEGTKWFASLTLINVEPDTAQRLSTNRSKREFPDNPTNPILNPNKEGMVGIDLSVTHSAVWTDNGTTAQRIIEERHMRLAEQKEMRRHKYQRVQSRKQETKYQEHGIKRDTNGAWPKDANKQLAIILNKKKKAAKEKLIAQGLPEKHHQERLFAIEQLFAQKSQNLLQIEEKVSMCYGNEKRFRADIIHNFTTHLVLNHHTIVLETLDLQEMAQGSNTGFRKSMHEACMGEIVRQLKYKCEWFNRTLIFVDKWFPSSKRCSTCHTKNNELKRSDTEWICVQDNCNTHNQRDDNATFNLWGVDALYRLMPMQKHRQRIQHKGWRLLELAFQQNNADMLAAGSVVRGLKGVIYESDKKTARKSQKRSNKLELTTPAQLSAIPTEKSIAKSNGIVDRFLKDKN